MASEKSGSPSTQAMNMSSIIRFWSSVRIVSPNNKQVGGFAMEGDLLYRILQMHYRLMISLGADG